MNSSRINNTYNDLFTKHILAETTSEENVLVESLLSSDNSLVIHYNNLKKIITNAETDPILQLINTDKAKSDFFDKIKSETKSKEAKVIALNSIPSLPQPKEKQINKPLKMKLIYLTSSVAACFFIVMAFWFFNRSEVAKKTNTTIAKQQTDTLPDGSIVYMNWHSSLTYDIEIERKRNAVFNSGEAFFKIAHQPNIPFTIQIDDYTVTVIGTAFNIKRSEKSAKISVTEGKVKVSNNESYSVFLGAGEMCEIDLSSNEQIQKQLIKTSNTLSWKTQKLIFEEADINTVINDIKSAYHINIELADSNLVNCTLTSDLDNQPADVAMQIVAISLDAELEFTDKTYILHKETPCYE